MKKILFNPLFLIGFFLRLGMILFISPTPVTEWYVPFLDASTNLFTLDPWNSWINHHGDPAAFPYGYAMWIILLPLALLAKTIELPLIWAYGATILLADFILLILLKKMIPNKNNLLLLLYWFSPIVVIASYWLGFNDLIPVVILTSSLYFLNHSRPVISGFLLILAISAKLSMVIAVPFIAIYFLHNRAMQQFLIPFLQGASISFFIFIVPFLFSREGMGMLFNNQEITKVFLMGFELNTQLSVYLVPTIYILTIYATWRTKRLNYELFNAMLGIAFLLVILLTPASPGWFIWAIPLLVRYQTTSNQSSIILVSTISILYSISTLFFIGKFPDLFGKNFPSIIHTAMVSIGIILTFRIWHENVNRNDYFRLSRKPFVIGIAGDSGSGKDTFSDAIKGLFGAHSVTTLSGDDYHLWDRQKPMWQVMTHLNPKANDLESFASDLISLTDGKPIHSRHYDHNTGRMSRPFKIKSNDFILASGLHALYMPILRECYNLSIYLDIDEKLRRHFKLVRDVNIRGHRLEKVLESFERREPDACLFIRPQEKHADLVFSIQPIHPHMLQSIDTSNVSLRFKLGVKSRHGLNETSLNRILVGICCLHVDMTVRNDLGEIELTIEGDIQSQDISLAAKMMCPQVIDFLDIEPKWADGILGIMQLITLSHINQALTKRFI
ncbi:uridine kinase [Cellvibrio sp. PSBB023]|uniref:uridine kinase n=1 Tax=Cellvibrio sp. PSBB023 TaxID=1945512 RepID=UPI00098F369D|nr:uridine kinase [Cellvibrio sp. PSBB023]AQT61384.1 uridine kinase [Cellvibrio sp. PSBB023]